MDNKPSDLRCGRLRVLRRRRIRGYGIILYRSVDGPQGVEQAARMDIGDVLLEDIYTLVLLLAQQAFGRRSLSGMAFALML